MKEYFCDNCGKKFDRKSNWLTHTLNKKKPCIKKITENIHCGAIKNLEFGANHGAIDIKSIDASKPNITCRFCFKNFLYTKNLNKHIREERCAILKLQKQQKENIFINLLTEEKIVNQTKQELNKINKIRTENEDRNQIEFLMNQINLLNDKLEKQKIESDKKIKLLTDKQKKDTEEQKKNTEEQIKMMVERYNELDKNNQDLKKTNEKLQKRMCKIVNKNNINNSGNTTNNTVINNPIIKLVNFGQENLEKISHKVFIDTIKTQGASLYNKAIEGIHFNKDYPENQNIYISDINRGKVMIYKDEKWFLDNWDSVYPDLLNKVIHFGYDKNDFLKDCGYKVENKKFNVQMIKNGMRWYKLLDDETPDIDYFELDPEDRPEIDEDTYNEYYEMYEFRKRHPKKDRESNIKNKIKLNMYNKREIPINNYKQVETDSKKLLQ